MLKVNQEKLFSIDNVVVDVVDQDHVKPIISLLNKKGYKQCNILIGKSTNVILVNNDEKCFHLLNNLHFEIGGESKISDYSIYMSNRLVKEVARYVKVVNGDKRYTTYSEYFDLHNLQDLKSKYKMPSTLIEEGRIYKVLYEGQHEWGNDNILVLALGNDQVGLIGEGGVEDVEVDNPQVFDKLVKYLTTDQVKIVDYVNYNLERVEVVDLTDDLYIKWRYVYCEEVHTDSLEYFLEKVVMDEIEENFYEVMKLDWDGLDQEYKMLSLARKVMRELK